MMPEGNFFKLYFRRPQRDLKLMSTLIPDSLSCEHEKYSGLVSTPVYNAMKRSKETYPPEYFKIGAARHSLNCFVTETVLKLPLLCANNSKARYDIVFIPAQGPSSTVKAQPQLSIFFVHLLSCHCLIIYDKSFLPIWRHNRLESGFTGLMFSIESHNETLSHNSTSMHFHWLIHVLENKVQNLGKSSSLSFILELLLLFCFVFSFQTTFITSETPQVSFTS